MARKSKQPNIPGIETSSPVDEELESRIEDLRVVRGERIAIQQREKVALDALLAYRRTQVNPTVVHHYTDDDGKARVAKFNAKITVSVRSEESADDDDDSDSQDDEESGVQVQ